MKKEILLFSVFLLLQSQYIYSQSVSSILGEFVESYKTDPMAMNTTFGIKVGQDWWTVEVQRSETAYNVGNNDQYVFHNFGPHDVSIVEGKPSIPTWYFRISDIETLEKINDKVWTATTAAAKSTPNDEVAMDIEEMDGFTPNQGTVALSYVTMEHFWKKDAAELTYFNRDSSLPSHGAAIVALYTMKDKRIAWFSLGKNESANTDRDLDRSQIPNLFIITQGKGKAIIGEEEIELKKGVSFFVGPYVKHTFFNTEDEPLEGILVLYGDNADYINGQSYIDFLEKEYSFYKENETENSKDE